MIQEFHRGNYWIPCLAIVLLCFGLFLNLGITPLYLEEPRRALIALEMIYNDNFWVPTEFGEYYYKKPPLFNWLIILGFELFGNYSELAVRFFSVVAFLFIGFATFLIGKRYVSFSFGVYNALLFYLCSDLLFYFSITAGEIDLVYSLITYLGFISIFHFYKRKQFYTLFILVYFLGALGTLTKGLTSPVFIVVSLTTFFSYQKEFSRLVSKQHLVGLMIYFSMVGLYAYHYNLSNDIKGFFLTKESLVSQFTERTVLQSGLLRFMAGLIRFPYLVFIGVFPCSLLALFLFHRASRRRVLNNEYLMFCLWMASANMLLYWLSPGTRSRYLFMFFPLIISLLFGLVYQVKLPAKAIVFWDYSQRGILIMFALASVFLPFIEALTPVSFIWVISLLSSAVLLLLFFVYLKSTNLRLILFIISVLVVRIVFDVVVLPVRAITGDKYRALRIAKELNALTKAHDVYLDTGVELSHTTAFYLTKEKKSTIKYESTKRKGTFYIINKADISLYHQDVFFEFEYNGDMFALIKLKS